MLWRERKIRSYSPLLGSTINCYSLPSVLSLSTCSCPRSTVDTLLINIITLLLLLLPLLRSTALRTTPSSLCTVYSIYYSPFFYTFTYLYRTYHSSSLILLSPTIHSHSYESDHSSTITMSVFTTPPQSLLHCATNVTLLSHLHCAGNATLLLLYFFRAKVNQPWAKSTYVCCCSSTLCCCSLSSFFSVCVLILILMLMHMLIPVLTSMLILVLMLMLAVQCL